MGEAAQGDARSRSHRLSFADTPVITDVSLTPDKRTMNILQGLTLAAGTRICA